MAKTESITINVRDLEEVAEEIRTAYQKGYNDAIGRVRASLQGRFDAAFDNRFTSDTARLRAGAYGAALLDLDLIADDERLRRSLMEDK